MYVSFISVLQITLIVCSPFFSDDDFEKLPDIPPPEPRKPKDAPVPTKCVGAEKRKTVAPSPATAAKRVAIDASKERFAATLAKQRPQGFDLASSSSAVTTTTAAPANVLKTRSLLFCLLIFIFFALGRS